MMAHRIKRALTLAVFALAMAMPAAAQSRIKSMPGYDQWAEISPKIAGSVRSGAIAPTWAADSASFDYTLEGVRWRYDVATFKAGRVEDAPGEPALAALAAASPSVTVARVSHSSKSQWGLSRPASRWYCGCISSNACSPLAW